MSGLKDLRDAIRDVLEDADDTGCIGMYTVDAYLLQTLQAEYNIHFVEPNDKQLDVL